MKPDKKQDIEKRSKKMPKKKGNNNIIIIAVAAVIIIGAIALFLGGSQTTEPKTTMTLKDVRALIDKEYGNKATGTNTPPVKDDYIRYLLQEKPISFRILPLLTR